MAALPTSPLPIQARYPRELTQILGQHGVYVSQLPEFPLRPAEKPPGSPAFASFGKLTHPIMRWSSPDGKRNGIVISLAPKNGERSADILASFSIDLSALGQPTAGATEIHGQYRDRAHPVSFYQSGGMDYEFLRQLMNKTHRQFQKVDDPMG